MKNLAPYIQEVDDYLKKIGKPVSKGAESLYDPVRYILSLGGKRFRPAVCLMIADMYEAKKEYALKIASSLEIFHNFTLVHDDIMDDAPIRRGKPTVHEKWNSNQAILSGDVMLIMAYQELLIAEESQIKPLLRVFNKTAIEVCEGQELDMQFEGRNDVSIDEYLEMIRLKTAVLVAASLQIGGLIGDASEEDQNQLYAFGENLGIAFQIQDDILDVYSTDVNFGKQKGGDIIANKKTYLLLKTLENDSVREELSEMVFNGYNKSDKVDRVMKLYDQVGVLNNAKEQMEAYFQKSLKAVEALSLDRSKKDILIDFATGLMNRTH